LAYYKIVKEFRDKLPRSQNEARIISEEEKSRQPALADLKNITVADLSTHLISVNEADIDLFYNKLNNFDYRLMLFKKYYKAYTTNLNRFNPKAENKNFDLFVVRQILKDDPLKPLRPLDVLIFHLKWEVKLTSKIYIWFLRRMKQGAHL
jgi:hypothetical protein